MSWSVCDNPKQHASKPSKVINNHWKLDLLFFHPAALARIVLRTEDQKWQLCQLKRITVASKFKNVASDW